MRLTGLNIILIVILLISLSIGGLVFASVATASIGNLQIYQGSAEITHSGKTIAGKTGTGINSSDTIKTAPSSKVAIVLKDNSVVRLDAETEVQVGEINYQGQKIKDADFQLKIGRLWSKVTPLSKDGQFNIETPTVVASVRGTNFNVTYRLDFTSIYVFQSEVDVKLKQDKSQTQKVTAGTFLRMQNDHLREDFQKGAQSPKEDFFDEWIIFNQGEDGYHPTPSPSPTSTPTPAPTSSPINVLGTTTKKATPLPVKTIQPTVKPTATPTTKPTSNPTANPTQSPTPSPTPKLTSFIISHNNTQTDCNPNCQFTATAYYSDNPNKGIDVTKDTKWSIKPVVHGSITSGGFYTANSRIIGDTIMGEYQGSSATHVIPSPSPTPYIIF